MNSGIVFKIKKYAIHDGPGIRTTIFLKGCLLDCWWCHNPEGKTPAPQAMKADHSAKGKREVVGKRMTDSEVLFEIEKDIIFYDESGGGVTFSGGEPLYQASFLLTLLNACRERGVHAALDTSGYAPSDIFKKVCNVIDMVLFDLKLMDDELHRRYTGVSNKKILKNLETLSKLNIPYYVRFPLIPGITDTDENVLAIAEFVRSLGTVNRIDILPMHRIADGKYRRLGMQSKMADKQPPSQQDITATTRRFEDFGFTVMVGG